jgi:uncharacterized protein (DUF1015 family)
MSLMPQLGIVEPEILLPATGVELYKWAVVACDQFTQDRAYWHEAARIVGGAPSALNLIFPECFLDDAPSLDGVPSNGVKAARIQKIHAAMRDYLASGVFAPPQKGFFYIERECTGGLRPGLLAAVDLECYEWGRDARSLIRATEGTIEARLPPRMDIRRDAPLELPHIMLLINDEEDALFRRLAQGSDAFAYDTELMQNGGRVRGRFVKDSAAVTDTLTALRDGGAGTQTPFLFAVGDGNHSLATAKAVWNEFKAQHPAVSDTANTVSNTFHPLRYALVEIVNIYSEALTFEPIHRVLLCPSALDLSPFTKNFKTHSVESREKLVRLVSQKSDTAAACCFGVIQGKSYILAEAESRLLATALVDPELTKLCLAHPDITLDYIHGEDELFALCEGGDTTVGFLLPPFEKKGLFETVAKTGPLPRKSFSMGHARDKRYYLEARSLQP